MNRRALATILLTVAALVAASCSSSGSDGADTTTSTTEATTTTTSEPDPELVDVDEWAADVCGSYERWVEELSADFAAEDTEQDPTDVEGGKAALSEVFAVASLQTKALIASIDDAGTPDVADGDQLVDDLVDAIETIDTAATQTQEEVARLDSPDPESFAASKDLIIEQFRAEVDDAAAALSAIDEQYPSPELTVAIEASCDF